MEDEHDKQRFQFSISSLFLVIAVVASGISLIPMLAAILSMQVLILLAIATLLAWLVMLGRKGPGGTGGGLWLAQGILIIGLVALLYLGLLGLWFSGK